MSEFSRGDLEIVELQTMFLYITSICCPEHTSAGLFLFQQETCLKSCVPLNCIPSIAATTGTHGFTTRHIVQRVPVKQVRCPLSRLTVPFMQVLHYVQVGTLQVCRSCSPAVRMVCKDRYSLICDVAAAFGRNGRAGPFIFHSSPLCS